MSAQSFFARPTAMVIEVYDWGQGMPTTFITDWYALRRFCPNTHKIILIVLMLPI